MAANGLLGRTEAGFHFTLLATNGRVIATSESYKTGAAALNGIESINKNALVPDTVDQTSVKRP